MNGTRAAETLSPRTPDQPMAFTPDEFLMGALWAWLFFLGLLAATEAALAVIPDVMAAMRYGTPSFTSVGFLGPALIISLLVAAPISGIAVLIAAPIVRRIAWRLRSRSSLWLHASVHAAVGAAVGALTILIVQAGFALWTDSAAPASALFGCCLIAAALTSASTVAGWGVALRNARRWDRGRRTARRIQGWIDQDAAVEDSAQDA